MIGATINVDGRLVVGAARVGADTALAHIALMRRKSQALGKRQLNECGAYRVD